MDQFGDRDGDGYLEYARDGDVGLENQGWEDAHDAVHFKDGAIARPPIALCEVQSYAYAARLGLADILHALGDSSRARRLRQDAAGLKGRFNRDFWLPERGYYAEALDGDKRPVDALTSNAAHLLWSGIVDADKARQVADHLLSPGLYSGWGVRMMASTERGYNPISYHNGSVWPHDTSLIVAGLARYGFMDEAARLVDGLLSALGQYADHRLPELFAGFGRQEVPFVVEYPTSSRPQAWASGSSFLLVAVMLGVAPPVPARPDDGRPFLPAGLGRLRVDGVTSGGQCIAIEVSGSGHPVRTDVARSAEQLRAG